jgi:ribosomal-protein-alanine N-acetyltransferase
MPLSPLTINDCKNAAQLHQEVFPRGWTEDTFREFLQSPHTFGLKSEEKNVLLGYILWREIEDEAEVLTLVVKPSAQKKGVGSLLIKNLLAHLKEKNIAKLFLEVAEDNEKAISFYHKHGFTFLSKRPNYYPREVKVSVSALNFYKKIL